MRSKRKEMAEAGTTTPENLRLVLEFSGCISVLIFPRGRVRSAGGRPNPLPMTWVLITSVPLLPLLPPHSEPE